MMRQHYLITGWTEIRRVIRIVSGVVALLFVAGVAASDTPAQGQGKPEAGKAIYVARCAVCHGAGGAGDGPVAGTLPDKPSNWTAGGGKLKSLGDQQLFEVIAKGGKVFGLSVAMPAHPDLSKADIWNVVAYVRDLMEGAKVADATSVPRPAAIEPESVRWGTTLDWASRLTISLSALILICIGISRLVYRGSQTEGNALWLHLLSLGVLPLSLLVVGNFAVLEYATHTNFCGACHLTMKPYLDDLYMPGGKSLAALHYQHRFVQGTDCYTCHANYGLHGTFEAKMTGLRDVYRYVTRTYHLPLKMRESLENRLCLKCHNEAKRYLAHSIHLTLEEPMRMDQIKCGGCHSPSHDIPRPKQAARPKGVG
jgi:mono/diheme cytochrome c family protein/nitrate/TMAO reductase-like tetraheme cytochrome c subunit